MADTTGAGGPPTAKKPSWFRRVWDDIFGSTATWEHTASTALTFAQPILTTVITLAGGPTIGAEAGKIISAVQNDLATASHVLATATGSTDRQKAISLIGGVQSNLSALLQCADIKNHAKVTDITLAVNTLGGELQAILDAV